MIGDPGYFYSFLNSYNCRWWGKLCNAASPYTSFVVTPTLVSMTEEKTVYGNEPATFNVLYLSTQSNTSAYWLFNNVPLPMSDGRSIITQEINATLGETMLQFEQLTRADRGMYTAVLHNNHPIIPDDRSTLRVNFRVDVHGILIKLVSTHHLGTCVCLTCSAPSPAQQACHHSL